MSDTSVTVKVRIIGWREGGKATVKEAHIIEMEPDAPLTALIDDIPTELVDFIVKSIVMMGP